MFETTSNGAVSLSPQTSLPRLERDAAERRASPSALRDTTLLPADADRRSRASESAPPWPRVFPGL